ncbi:MAG: hybrid sensor histidine kinase/response regulator [Magnetococcales bacterium]|nr:hybrid sensor histidine kinase/response regulator [Magnetococcales bacterium]
MLKILVVDDEMIVRCMLEEILTGVGYEVITAEDGAAGWERLRVLDDLSLVVSDLNMPRLSGLEFILRVRESGNDVPIIILTSSNEMSVAIDAINKGADDYLLKDENIHDMLLISVRKVLEMRQISRKNRQLMLELESQNKKLEGTLEELQKTYEDLKLKKEQLIQSEKMASLGRLVAGVSHEINTPVGISVTGASALVAATSQIVADYQNKAMKRSDLEHYLRKAEESAQLILLNLSRTAELIRSFKMVAVDQTSQEKRSVRIKSYLLDIVTSLRPRLKDNRYVIEIQCDETLEISSTPGAIAQVFTNLIMNSLIHGFADREHGRITIDVLPAGDWVRFHYRDDGQGIAPENLGKIFDPFFTTRRNQGSTGLGLNIIFNLVEQNLGGTITCESLPDQGVFFVVSLPMRA